MSIATQTVLAQAVPGAAGGGFTFLLPVILFFVVMFFFTMRPQMKRQKEHRQLVAGLAKGDEVVSNGGIAGKVEEVGENFVTVEIAPNVKIKLQKSAVQQVLPKGSLKAS